MHVPITLPAFTSVSAVTAAMTCEECRCAVALVVVGAPLDLAGTHRQKRLRSIKGLYLALFIDADDQRLLGRIEIEADDVAHLLDERRACDHTPGGIF